ncbi:MAG: pyridoxal phosphate-dependent aminotransferase [Armatimonadota bacterium]
MGLADQFIPGRLRNFRPRDSGGGDRVRLLNLARGLADVISLNSGDPDLTAAPVAVEAAVDALRSGKTHYAHGGLPELRAAIARKLAAENGFTVEPDTQVIITNGSAEAASSVFQTLLEPGDEVLTTDPCYSGHVSAVNAARGVAVYVPTRGEDLWEPDPAEVERRITPRTKAFVFANPGNPTAAVYRRETLEGLLDVAHRKNILMIPDELFERYVYDGHRHVSMASLHGAADRVVTISGFSKSYCMTGWRLGWIAAPAWLAEPLANVRYALSMTASTPNMWGAIAALSDAARPYYNEVYRTYGERRAFFHDALTRMGLPQRPTPGAFVCMANIQPTGRTGSEVAETFLKEARVFIWPGTVFGSQGEGYLRVGLIQPLDTLREMVRRLEPVVAGLVAAGATRPV